MGDYFFLFKAANKAKGTERTKARFADMETAITLDAALGSPHDLTHYQDCLDAAKAEGAGMSPEQKQRARELSRNPRRDCGQANEKRDSKESQGCQKEQGTKRRQAYEQVCQLQ